MSAWSTALKKLYKYMGTRNVRLQSRGLPKGMGQTRQGTVKIIKRKSTHDPLSIPRASQAMGGGRIFTPSGGGKSRFMTKGSTYGHTRGTKIAGGTTAGGAVVAGVIHKPSGPATAGEKQFTAVTALRGLRTKPTKSPIKAKASTKSPAWHGDVASFSKSGYHKFKKGSKSAKAFQQSYAIAKKTGAKNFTWGLTGKKYKV